MDGCESKRMQQDESRASHGARHADQGRKPYTHTHTCSSVRSDSVRAQRGLDGAYPPQPLPHLQPEPHPQLPPQHDILSLDLANKNTDELNERSSQSQWTDDLRPCSRFIRPGGGAGQPSGRPRGAGSGCSRDVRSYAPAPLCSTALAVAVHGHETRTNAVRRASVTRAAYPMRAVRSGFSLQRASSRPLLAGAGQ